MSRLALLTVLAAMLPGCSDLDEFERELLGDEAKAWTLCKARMKDISTAPPYGETTGDHILFGWKGKSCKTNATGTEIIEITQ